MVVAKGQLRRSVQAPRLKHTYQLLQILAVLPTETPVSFPYPIPTWSIPAASGKEYDCVVCFDCAHKAHSISFDVSSQRFRRTYHIIQDMRVYVLEHVNMIYWHSLKQ